MDVRKTVKNYVIKMLDSASGLKVLLLDSYTTSVVSMVLTQSQLLEKEVFLVDKIQNNGRNLMKHMKAICFVRPTSESIQSVIEELRNPKYGSYHLYFSNLVRKSQIERMAEVDDYEVVTQVHEFYADYLANRSDLYSFGLLAPNYRISGDSLGMWDGSTFDRTVEGLVSVLLSLKKKPLIMYQKNSQQSNRLAKEISLQMLQESKLFDFRRPQTPPVLLILDRKNDPITPLLSQWTYQAMVHEHFGIKNGRVDLSRVEEIRPELREIVLTAESDPFFEKNMFLNFGDLGANIRNYVEEFQAKTHDSTKLESISAMKQFVEQYPEFRKLKGNVSKHVALVGELHKLVTRNNLFEVGELEQSLASNDNHGVDYKALQALLVKDNIPSVNKIRLVMLYALRYEKNPSNKLPTLINLLKQSGIDDRLISSINAMMKYAGNDKRQGDIFQNQSLFSKGKQVFKGLQGVENIYQQHEPYLKEILESLSYSKLDESLYPTVEGTLRNSPSNVIIYIIGGVTYAESKLVAEINSTNSLGMRVVLGGSSIINSLEFVQNVTEAVSRSQSLNY